MFSSVFGDDFFPTRELIYVVTHVFFPVNTPEEEEDYTKEGDCSLVRAVCTAAHAYHEHIDATQKPQWHHITKTLDNLLAITFPKEFVRDHFISQLGEMDVGGTLSCSF